MIDTPITLVYYDVLARFRAYLSHLEEGPLKIRHLLRPIEFGIGPHNRSKRTNFV